MKNVAILAFAAGLVVSGAAFAHPHFSSGGSGMNSGMGHMTYNGSTIKDGSTDDKHMTDDRRDQRDFSHMTRHEDRHDRREIEERLHRLQALKWRLERDLLRDGDKRHVRHEIARLIEKIERLERIARIDGGYTADLGDRDGV